MQESPVAALLVRIERKLLMGHKVILWGSPGCGKTALIYGLGQNMGKLVIVIIGSQCEGSDINGIPVVTQAKITTADGRELPQLKFAPRDLFVMANEAPNGAIIVFDEFNCSPPDVLAPILRLMSEGVAGDYKLDMSKVCIVAIANPTSEAVNGHELAEPMRTRLSHYRFPMGDAVAKEWAEKIVNYFGVKKVVGMAGSEIPEEFLMRARSYVAGFIYKLPHHWYKPPVEGEAGDDTLSMTGGPCARTWDRVADTIAFYLWKGLPIMEAYEDVVADVGPNSAIEFQAYMSTAAIPDPEALLADPESVKPSGRVDVDFATLMSVGGAVAAKLTTDRILAAAKIANHMTQGKAGNKESAGEAAMVLVLKVYRLMEGNWDKLLKTFSSNAKVTAWMKEYRDVMAPYNKLVNLAKMKMEAA